MLNHSLRSLVHMRFNYENLTVVQEIRSLIRLVYELTKILPYDERRNLKSQLQRSATSVLLNIAEGSSRQSRKEFARFINISIGSLVEVDAILNIMEDVKYLSPDARSQIDPLIQSIYFKLVALRKSQTH